MSIYGLLIEARGIFGEEVFYKEDCNLNELVGELVGDALEWLGTPGCMCRGEPDRRNERKLMTLDRKLGTRRIKPSELRGFRYEQGEDWFQVAAVVKGDEEIAQLKREYTRCCLD